MGTSGQLRSEYVAVLSGGCSGADARQPEGALVKGSQKPKKLGKKPAQKTLKERRVEKREAAKQRQPLGV